MKKAYEYYRNGHGKDSDCGITSQQINIRKYAEENNLKIVGTYIDESKTGTTNRKAYQKMLSDLKKNPDVKCIVVSSLDQLHRNVSEQLNLIYELKAKKIEILTITGIKEIDEKYFSEILDCIV